MKTAEEFADKYLGIDSVGTMGREQFVQQLHAYGEQVKLECAKIARQSKDVALTMRAVEHARVAATIEDRVLALKLP